MSAEYKLEGTVVDWLQESNLKVQVALLDESLAGSKAKENRAAIEANRNKAAPKMVRNVSASFRTESTNGFVKQEFVKYAAICDPGSRVVIRVRSKGPAGFWASVRTDHLNIPIVDRLYQLDRSCETGEHELTMNRFTYYRKGKEERLIRVDDKDLLDPEASTDQKIARWTFLVNVGQVFEFTEKGKRYQPGLRGEINSLVGGFHVGNATEGERADSGVTPVDDIKSDDTVTGSMLIHLFVPTTEGRKLFLDLKSDEPIPTDW